MIIIGYNYEGKVIGIVNAESEKLAHAFWHGRNVIPHSTKIVERDFTSLEEHPHGVYPLLETKEMDGYSMGEFTNRNKKFIVIK